MQTELVANMVKLPRELLAAVDAAVRAGQAESRDELVIAALQHEFETRERAARAAEERAAIDADLAEMGRDPEYQREALAMAEEFVSEEWKLLREAEEKE